VLAASLVAYVALWIGDAVHGVFAVMGAPQVAILTSSSPSPPRFSPSPAAILRPRLTATRVLP
jgi:hypothetical protein